jgi:hypothetical protein
MARASRRRTSPDLLRSPPISSGLPQPPAISTAHALAAYPPCRPGLQTFTGAAGDPSRKAGEEKTGCGDGEPRGLGGAPPPPCEPSHPVCGVVAPATVDAPRRPRDPIHTRLPSSVRAAGNTKGSEGYGEITQGSLQRLCCLLGDLRATILSKLCEAPWPRAWDLRSDSCVHGTPPSKPGARGSANDGLTPG